MAKPLVQTVGRRKASIARVQMRDGTGLMSLNGRPLENYFPNMAQRIRILEPLRTSGVEGQYDVTARLEGGGLTGQSDALRLGIARALIAIDPELRPPLKKAGMLTRDSRKVERKKYGLKKARRAEQFTKR